jgi:thioester reductase-like protein
MSTFWRELAAAEVTSFGAPPKMFSLLHYLHGQRAAVIGSAAADSECKAIFGKSCSAVYVGGALTSPELLLWMRGLWGELVVDAYGCTECGSIARNGILDSFTRAFVEPESHSFSSSATIDDGSVVGILWVHTRNCATGYYAGEHSSDFRVVREVSLAGDPQSVYYCTGDRVRFWSSRNMLKVIGRSKSKLRLSDATFLDADAVQTAVSCSKKGFYSIGSVLITCRSSSSIVVAIVQIRSHIQASNALKQEILKEMQVSCSSMGIPGSWIPRHILLDTELWSADNGCATGSGKLHRLGIETRFAKDLDQIFEISEHHVGNSRPDGHFEQWLTFDMLRTLILECAPSASVLSLQCDLSLGQNGYDSISIVRIASRLQKCKTKFPVPITALHSLSLTELARSYCRESNSCDLGHISFESSVDVAEVDAQVAGDLRTPMVASPENQSSSGIFLTGASGFLGIHILCSIMRQLQLSNVFCLVRGCSEQEALARLKIQAADADLDICWSRVHVIVGDLSLPLFGLCPSDFASLATKVGMIIHNGAFVHWLKGYHNLRQSNVVGTQTCARLALMASVKVFIFVSTSSSITSSERYSSGKPGSSLLSLSVTANMCGYSASKRVAEVFLCRFASCHPGMALHIVRPATIISSPSPSSYNLHDGFARYIQACFQLRTVPLDDSVLLHFVPVDFVANLVVKFLVRSNSSRSSLLNVLCGVGLPLSVVSRCICSACSLHIDSLLLPIWLRNLNSDCPTVLLPLLHIFQRDRFPWSLSTVDCELHDDTVIFHDLSEKSVESSARWVATKTLSA